METGDETGSDDKASADGAPDTPDLVPGSGIVLGSNCPDTAVASGEFEGIWSVPGAYEAPTHAYQVTTPAGGDAGALVLELTSPGDFRSRVDIIKEGALAKLLDSSTHDDTETWVYGIYAEAGTTYDLHVSPPEFVMLDEYPRDYTLQWSYTPIPDCNEPNDVAEQATRAKVEDTIEGYMVAGAVEDGLASQRFQDWFTVDLPTSGTFAITVEQAPQLIMTQITIFNAATREQVGFGWGGPGLEPLYSVLTDERVPAGTYLFVVEPAGGDSARPLSQYGNDDEPQNTPYRLTMTVLDQGSDAVITGEPEEGLCLYQQDCEAPALCVEQECKVLPVACSARSDCSAGSTCDEGRCEQEEYLPCQNDDQCPLNQGCVVGKCIEVLTLSCRDEEDCPTDMACEASACMASPGCHTDTDCGVDAVCVWGSCKLGPAFCSDNSECADGTVCALSCVEAELGRPCTRRDECAGKNSYCDTLVREECRLLCETDAECEGSNYRSHAAPFSLEFSCIEALNAFGETTKECRSRCSEELHCPIRQSCTGQDAQGKYCEYADVNR